MSLRRALEALPQDRAHVATAREILALFRRNPETWISHSDVRARLSDPSDTRDILRTLVDYVVLDADEDWSRFRLIDDSLLHIEIDRFVRRVERHDQRTQTNVARFRQRYHCS